MPQQPWIVNATVRENVLMGAAFEGARYRRTLRACALEADLARMDDGDATEIGERGVTLSGGQRLRVALARACYSDCSLVLLDDPLSAVDAHVGKVRKMPSWPRSWANLSLL